MIPSMLIMRRLNRDRVLTFEAELSDKLGVLTAIEAAIKETSHQRAAWLKHISQTYQNESEVHNKMIAVIKAQTELSALHLRLDVLGLEGQYETQKLHLLIDATRPLDENETPEDREMQLMIKARSHADLLANSLEGSLSYRMALMDRNHSLHHQLLDLHAKAQSELAGQIEDVRIKLSTYKSKMTESVAASSETYQGILRDYLLFRHNAHVAEEILARSQTDASHARHALSQCVERIITEAAHQKDTIASAAAREVTLQTHDLRKSVMEKEYELDAIQQTVQRLQHARANEMSALQQEVHDVELAYRQLQDKRRHDLTTVQMELSALQGMVNEKQAALQGVGVPGREEVEALRQLRQLIEQLALDHKDEHHARHLMDKENAGGVRNKVKKSKQRQVASV